MPQTPYKNTLIYNTIEKVNAYWEAFKPKQHLNKSYQERWLSHASLFDSISLQSRVCVTLWDAATNQFIYAADKTNVLGDSASHFTEPGGIDYTYLNMHEEHRQAQLMMQKQGIEYCIEHKEYMPDNITMNADYAYNKNGKYIHILQQVIVVETTSDNHPLLYLSYVYDITHLKNQNSANLVITAPDETLMWEYDFDKKKLTSAKMLTKQERKILMLLGEAKHTKELAESLEISPNTVNNHRSNLLAKTNCLDTTAMVTYCKMVGLM
jgi:DNA-binding CsgD family transcriptional regulator